MTQITPETQELLVEGCLSGYAIFRRHFTEMDLRSFAVGWFASRFTTTDTVALLVRRTLGKAKEPV